MPDIFASALASDGLMWIALATFLAGLVRGFAGFGTAMIYLPIASQFLSPVEALVTLTLMDCLGPVPAMPRALREADWPDLRRLIVAMTVFMPIGLWLLVTVPDVVFRFGVSAVSLLLLAALVLGLRYTGQLSASKVFGVGASAGVLGGAVGLPGPPVIFFYMASAHPTHVIRATTMVFLVSYDLIIFAMMGVQGLLSQSGLVLGALLILPMISGVVLGTWLFRPEYEKVYRTVAYVLIAASALSGLPIWG
ncbi:sulfite exporter TauE/SafE family protein [Planktotalea sp.]|uniref:sulfite exporter TauE/SafE family protein n=1 Tax=Planktotalea sp. TaxID=2029877 RepID=UPI003D6B3073